VLLGALVMALGIALGCFGAVVEIGFGGTARAAAPLIVDGDFEANENGNQLRAREAGGQGWYESRNRQGPEEARLLLKLSTKSIGGNKTCKAMIKAHPEHNTYLSQCLAEPTSGRFSLQWDIYVREILPPYNRSAFQMIGNARQRGRGPNGSGKERFVFLGFAAGTEPGKVDLFAFEGRNQDQWDEQTILVRGLDLEAWHTIRVDVDVEHQSYQVSVVGVTDEPSEVQAFRTKKDDPPETLTHLSFASWDNGLGTFYVDNVIEPVRR